MTVLVYEEWRAVPGWAHYQVSSIGRVRSLDRLITDRLGRTRVQRGRLKRTWVDDGGYRRVELNHGSRLGIGVHRLVALAFHGQPRPDQESRHLDGDSLNNCAENIAWGTHSENVRDTIAAGRYRNHNAEKVRCPQGHPYSGRNRRGDRKCATCRRASQQAYRGKG